MSRRPPVRSGPRARSRDAPGDALPPVGKPVPAGFFERDAQEVAASLLGLVLCHRIGRRWLMASLVEAEAYYLEDRASHASLGFTPKRRALFMPAGTIYMYYARGGDSFNVSVRGAGNAVLFKAGLPLLHEHVSGADARRWSAADAAAMLARMRRLNPLPPGTARPSHRLCAGQTLLCRSLGLKVTAWDARPLPSAGLVLVDTGYRPRQVVRARRLGIPAHRDPHLLYRFVDLGRAQAATRHPIGKRAQEGVAYEVLPASKARAR